MEVVEGRHPRAVMESRSHGILCLSSNAVMSRASQAETTYLPPSSNKRKTDASAPCAGGSDVMSRSVWRRKSAAPRTSRYAPSLSSTTILLIVCALCVSQGSALPVHLKSTGPTESTAAAERMAISEPSQAHTHSLTTSLETTDAPATTGSDELPIIMHGHDSRPPADFFNLPIPSDSPPRTERKPTTEAPATTTRGHVPWNQRHFLTKSSTTQKAVEQPTHAAPERPKETCHIRSKEKKVPVCRGRKIEAITISMCKGSCFSEQTLRFLPATHSKPSISDFFLKSCRCCKAKETSESFISVACPDGLEDDVIRVVQPISCECSACD